MAHLTLGLVQVDPNEDKAANVNHALELVGEAAAAGARFIALPETFHCRGPNEVKFATAEPIPGPLSAQLSKAAARHNIYLLAGSYSESVDDGNPRLFNTSLLFDPEGNLLAQYRKIHLFDVVIDGHFKAHESSRNRPGDQLVTAETAYGTVGLSICYDLRFPEVYRHLALRGAVLSFVPANFALYTGKDHWETLLRARAIENGMYIVAPATIGSGGGSFTAYGRSMVVDPWGTVLACATDQVGITLVTIDLERVQKVRENLPSLAHRRPEAYTA